MDQGSNKNHSLAYNFTPTVTKFCVMWEGLSLPHDTKFGNCRCKIVDSRSFHSWSLIHGLRWSGLIKVGPVPHGPVNMGKRAKPGRRPHQRKAYWLLILFNNEWRQNTNYIYTRIIIVKGFLWLLIYVQPGQLRHMHGGYAWCINTCSCVFQHRGHTKRG